MEIKANELRLGNKLTCKVRGIEDRFDIVDVNLYHLKDIFNSNIEYSYQPIPLTEEWLLKFGYLISDDEGDIKHFEIGKSRFGIRVYDNSDFYLYYSIGNDEYIILSELNFLHQLQNLYFALTGEELTHTP